MACTFRQSPWTQVIGRGQQSFASQGVTECQEGMGAPPMWTHRVRAGLYVLELLAQKPCAEEDLGSGSVAMVSFVQGSSLGGEMFFFFLDHG